MTISPLMQSLSRLLAMLAIAGLAGCTTPQPLQTVRSVDLNRYYGTWYEIARLPNRFQAKCASDVQATYRPQGENVTVVNQCRVADGGIDQADGIAKPVKGSNGAKLRVSFFWPIYGDYWVLALDPDYRWVLVGEPGRKYAWILAREAKLDETTFAALLASADALGFDRQAFVKTPHTQSAH